jgi:hypothetical protein
MGFDMAENETETPTQGTQTRSREKRKDKSKSRSKGKPSQRAVTRQASQSDDPVSDAMDGINRAIDESTASIL